LQLRENQSKMKFNILFLIPSALAAPLQVSAISPSATSVQNIASGNRGGYGGYGDYPWLASFFQPPYGGPFFGPGYNGFAPGRG
jgi:hypothetical protein